MRKNSIIGIAFVFSVLPSITLAQLASSTPPDTTSIIASLQAEVKLLTQELVTLIAAKQASISSASSLSCTITRNLVAGMQGGDVSCLQKFLISQGVLPAADATGYFGALTLVAVQAVQSRQGIVSSGMPYSTGYGAVGPRTRALIASLMDKSVSTTTPLSSLCPTAPPTTLCNGSWQQVALSVTAAPNSCTMQWSCISSYYGGGGGGGGVSPLPSSMPDTTPPTVSFALPAVSSTVSGIAVVLTAAASDISTGSATASGVANVQFQVDGNNIGAPVTSQPYSVTWDSEAVSDGVHTLSVIAEDSAGNYATATVTITVQNIRNDISDFWPANAPSKTWNIVASSTAGSSTPTQWRTIQNETTGSDSFILWYSNGNGLASGQRNGERYHVCRLPGRAWLFFDGYINSTPGHATVERDVVSDQIFYTTNGTTTGLIKDGEYAACGGTGQPYLLWSNTPQQYRLQVWGHLTTNVKDQWYWDVLVNAPSVVTNNCLSPSLPRLAMTRTEAWWSNFIVTTGRWTQGGGTLDFSAGWPSPVSKITYGRTDWDASGDMPYFLVGGTGKVPTIVTQCTNSILQE